MPATRNLPVVTDPSEMRDWAEQLVARARIEGIELTGDNGLLTAMGKMRDLPGEASTPSSRVIRSAE